MHYYKVVTIAGLLTAKQPKCKKKKTKKNQNRLGIRLVDLTKQYLLTVI